MMLFDFGTPKHTNFFIEAFFSHTLVFWLIIGFALVAYIQEVLLRSVYKQMEEGSQPASMGM